jgi:hypothetical protein
MAQLSKYFAALFSEGNRKKSKRTKQAWKGKGPSGKKRNKAPVSKVIDIILKIQPKGTANSLDGTLTRS